MCYGCCGKRGTSLIGGGWTERKERVWKTRISSRLMHKQSELVVETERQRGTATYTEAAAAAKSNLDDGTKERHCLPPWLWGWVTLGDVFVAVSGSAHRQCSVLSRAGALRDGCREQHAAAARNSIMFHFSCQNCGHCEFC